MNLTASERFQDLDLAASTKPTTMKAPPGFAALTDAG